MKQVIIMLGVSGSGKSTYAMNLMSRENTCAKSLARVSADFFFSKSGSYIFDPAKLGEAHAWCFRNFLDELRGKTELVIVDNTNSTPMEISPYMLGAQAFGYEAKIIRVLCSPRLAYERGKHGVSLASIEACEARIRESQLPPWWALEEVDGEASVTRMVKP